MRPWIQLLAREQAIRYLPSGAGRSNFNTPGAAAVIFADARPVNATKSPYSAANPVSTTCPGGRFGVKP
jgi:hypothetical protein